MNETYYTNLINQINSCSNCSDLDTLSTKAISDISNLSANISSQLLKLAPLMVPPTTLPTLITWAAAMVEMFAGPYATLTTQQTQAEMYQSQIMTAVSAKKNSLGCS